MLAGTPNGSVARLARPPAAPTADGVQSMLGHVELDGWQLENLVNQRILVLSARQLVAASQTRRREVLFGPRHLLRRQERSHPRLVSGLSARLAARRRLLRSLVALSRGVRRRRLARVARRAPHQQLEMGNPLPKLSVFRSKLGDQLVALVQRHEPIGALNRSGRKASRDHGRKSITYAALTPRDPGERVLQNYLTTPPNFRAPLVRDGYVLDVEPSLPTELYPYHFHEINSADAWWLPVRTSSGSGVLARDSSAGEDPLVITREAQGETFVVRRVSVGFSSSQESATSLVRMSGYHEGTLVGSADFSMAQNTYTDYQEAGLQSLAGASVDRLEFLGLTSGGEPYALYMLDDIELSVTAP
jgi:hypothetical protein